MNGIATIRDVEAIKARRPGDLLASTSLDPGAPALSFFLTADEHRRPEKTTDDASRGMTARGQLDPGESDGAARHVLGRFALPFTISTASHEGAPS